MEELTLPILVCLLLTGCNDQPSSEVNTSSMTQAAVSPDTTSKPQKSKSPTLVNNSAPIPKGYKVDTTYVKQPIKIDFNGDGKLDAFSVLYNAQKTDKKYLFEFRIADSNNVYYFENDDDSYDLDIYGVFDVAQKNEVYVDQLLASEDGDIVSEDMASPDALVKLKNNGILANVVEETCATSLFYLEDEKIKRIYLC